MTCGACCDDAIEATCKRGVGWRKYSSRERPAKNSTIYSIEKLHNEEDREKALYMTRLVSSIEEKEEKEEDDDDDDDDDEESARERDPDRDKDEKEKENGTDFLFSFSPL